MELVSRMMDGSIPQPPEPGPGSSDTPARLRQDEKMTYLQRVQLFEACSSRQLRAIARIALLRGDQSSADAFRAKAEQLKENVQRKLWDQNREFFGEMSLIDGEPRSATVTADTAMRLLLIQRRDFMTLLGEVPSLTERMLVTLCQRVRKAEKALTA